MQLAGHIAIVTGSSKGIGYSVADYLMRHGAEVTISARKAEEVSAAAQALEAKHAGRRALAVVADVTKAADVERLFDETEAKRGPVAIVVNNAGGSTIDTIANMPEEDWNAIIAVNLTGTFLGTKAAIRRMRATQTAGVIINIGSVEAHGTTRGNAHYTAAKAGISKLTQVAALEAGRFGIRVNTVSPGVVVTPLTQTHTNEGFQAAWKRTFAIDRFGAPEDIAKAVTFLASDYASWITGVDILVDGGTHLRGLPDFVDHLIPGQA
jgi:3-oxoacyl-[acyl-carrier protein] reductase